VAAVKPRYRRRVRLLIALPLVLAACGDDDAPASSGPAVDPPACQPAPAPVRPAGACNVSITTPPVADSRHVPEGTALSYCTNPPSSGRHYPVWAAFQEYAAPVEAPYLVHSMEHGAVVLFYRCDTGCPDVVAELRRIRDATPKDPACRDVNARVILLPSTTIPTRVAAAAWGATYTADCVDAPSLEGFLRERYAKGPEDTCAPGRSF